MTDLPAETASLPARMGARGRVEGDSFHGWVDVVEPLCSHGVLRASVLAMLADMAAGYVAAIAAEGDWTFTTDLSVRHRAVTADRVHGRTELLRAGRSMSIDVPMTDDAGHPVAHGVATFKRVDRRPDDPPLVAYSSEMGTRWPVADRPLEELLGAEVVDDRRLRLALRPEVLNPAHVLQGGVAALLAEISAQRVIESLDGGRPHIAVGLDVRYVAMGRVGPIIADVHPLTDGATAVVRLLDAGADDRVVVHTIVDLHPAPGS